MSYKNKSAKIEILSLKIPTSLDKVIEKVPKPEKIIPNFGLPKWKTMPLESKIPMIPAPISAYEFSRQKLGKKLWISSPNAEYNLSDPYNNEIKLQYDGFHDKDLTDFYKKPINIQRMIQLGFVSRDLNVKCSLKEYNMYRKYLKKLHNDSIKKELKKREEIHTEMTNIKLAEDRAKKDLERLRKREHVENFKEVKAEQIKIRENKWKSNIEKYYDQLKKIEQIRIEALNKQMLKRKEKVEKINQIRKMSVKLERKKLVKIKTDWKRKERKRIKMRNLRLQKEKEEKDKLIKDRWKMKQELQIQGLAREEFLKHSIDEKRQIFIQEYNKKIEKERRRMQKLLEESKKFTKCYMARLIPKHKKRSCCKTPKVDEVNL